MTLVSRDGWCAGTFSAAFETDSTGVGWMCWAGFEGESLAGRTGRRVDRRQQGGRAGLKSHTEETDDGTPVEGCLFFLFSMRNFIVFKAEF